MDKQTDDVLDIDHGISSQTGGVLWVPYGGHFLQESDDIEWIIHKALKYFGDIPYSDVEYEWMISPKSKKVNIIKIMLNKPPINVLTLEMINGLNNIFDKFNNNEYCDGYIMTSNVPSFRRKNNKLPIFCPGYDLKQMAKKDRALTKKYFFASQKLDYLQNISPKPIIAALNGSTIAGGTLVILRCDYRIMFEDCYIAMNEVRNGIKIDKSLYNFIKRFTGSDNKTLYVLQTGRNFYGKQAKEYGLIDECIKGQSIKKLINRSLNVLENEYFIAEKEAAAIARKVGREDLIKHYREYTDANADKYCDTFFDPKVQSAINKLFSNKGKKSKL